MVWAIRIVKLSLLGASFLVFGYTALVVIGAAILLLLLLSADDAFWGGILG